MSCESLNQPSFEKTLSKGNNNEGNNNDREIPPSKYQRIKEDLDQQRKSLQPIIEEASRKRDQLLNGRGNFLMTKEDFIKYFFPKGCKIGADLKQQNICDCYVVAAIYAMSLSPHFEMICRSSMKRMSDGSWQVRIPLLSENGQMITITKEEISPQWNKKFLRRGNNNSKPDLRLRLKPLKGKEGLRVLEAAFIKAKFGILDRLAAEGGSGDEVLLRLGGKIFKEYYLSSVNYNYKKERLGLNSLPEEGLAYLDHYLENFDPEVDMATASTRKKVTLKFLAPYHVYSISNVDREKGVVTLANPWNTSKPIKLTFDQFKENFFCLGAIRIDSLKLLQSMNKIEKS